MEKILKEPNPEELEAAIEALIEKLYGYTNSFDSLSAEMQENWYWAEMEAKAGLDRQEAKRQLEQFLMVLEVETKK